MNIHCKLAFLANCNVFQPIENIIIRMHKFCGEGSIELLQLYNITN